MATQRFCNDTDEQPQVSQHRNSRLDILFSACQSREAGMVVDINMEEYRQRKTSKIKPHDLQKVDNGCRITWDELMEMGECWSSEVCAIDGNEKTACCIALAPV